MRLIFLRSLYLHGSFFMVLAGIAVLYIIGYFLDPFFVAAKIGLGVFLLVLGADIYLLYFTGNNIISFVREVPEKLSNGDNNKIKLYIKNNHFYAVRATIIDEIPVQFQVRDFAMHIRMGPHSEKKLEYELRPVRRGEYEFGKVNVYIRNTVGMVVRRFSFYTKPLPVPVYPSFLNIRKYEFLAISNRLTEAGIKKIRRLGHFHEFDQIREYSRGDDIRLVNWKATAKRDKLMSNQYQDERSQQIYSIINMGRAMKMPFDGMSLLDYAINSSLVLANIAIYKQDKAGLITFNTNINTFFPAERRNNTVNKFLEILYKQETLFHESNFELLYATLRQRVSHRSLLILYTNFEAYTSLERQILFLQKLARYHLLMVVFFENTEISKVLEEKAGSLEDVYIHTIARKFVYDKQLIVKELQRHGILSILTPPSELTVNLINRYLELKNRGMI